MIHSWQAEGDVGTQGKLVGIRDTRQSLAARQRQCCSSVASSVKPADGELREHRDKSQNWG